MTMKHLLLSFSATIFIQLITIAQGVLSARWLLPEGKGELTIAMLWPSLFVALGCLGIQDAVAFAAAKSSETDIKRLVASGLTIALLITIALVAAGYVLLPFILSGHSAELVSISKFYLWYIPPTMATFCLMGILLGQLQVAQVNILRVSVYVVILVLMVLFYWADRVSVRNFASAFLISSWICFLLAVAFVIKRGWIGFQASLDMIKKLLGYGAKVHIGSIAGLLNLRLDQLLLSVLLPASSLGLYVVAVTIGSGASLAASTIAYWIAFPILSSLPSGLLKTQIFGRFIRFALSATLLSALILFVGVPWLINVFFGAAYGASADMARILIIAAIPWSCNTVFAAGFRSYNLPEISSWAEIFGLMVSALALLILLPKFGALGAAGASLLAYSATFLYLLMQFCKKMNVQVGSLLLPIWDDWYYLKGLLMRIGRNRLSDQR